MIDRSSRNSTHPSSEIKVMSVAEACAQFYGFFKAPSLKINPLPFGSDVSNKLFDAPKTQSMIDVESLNSDIRLRLFQVPVMLCEVERLQISLRINSNIEIDADTSLSQKRDMRDKLSNDLCVSLITLMDSQEIRNISHPKSKKNLDELLYEIALTLANLNPVNDIDFATQEPIAPENRIVTSDRYQYDINSLQQWLCHKNTNPWTNLKFTRRDINSIKVNLQSRKPSDEIEIYEVNSHPGGDPNIDATIALAHSLEEPAPRRIPRGMRIDFDMSAWPINIASPNRPNDEHHEVESIRERPRSSLFFRRQTNRAHSPLLSEFEAEAWRAYRALGHANRSRHQTTVTSEPYVGIRVADIPNFNEPRENSLRYNHQIVIMPTETFDNETASPNTEDINHAKDFKERITFFITHHHEWLIQDQVTYIMNALLYAYSVSPVQIRHAHDVNTSMAIDNRLRNFFRYMPNPTRFLEQMEDPLRLTNEWIKARNHKMAIDMHVTVTEYAQQLTSVISFIDSYLAHHSNNNEPTMRV